MTSTVDIHNRNRIFFTARPYKGHAWGLAMMLGLTTLLVLSGEASLGVATGRPQTATGKLFSDPLTLSEQDGRAAVVKEEETQR